MQNFSCRRDTLQMISLLVVFLAACEDSPPGYLGDRDTSSRDSEVEVDPLSQTDMGSTAGQSALDMTSESRLDDSLPDRSIIEGIEAGVPSPSCISACDCAEGQSCFEGLCIQAAQPSYCCDRDLCPSGNFCDRRDGSRALCSSEGCLTACDCPTGQACVNERCQLSEELGLTYCCEDPSCPAGRECQIPTGELSVCQGEAECAVTCDCSDLPGTVCRGQRCVFPPADEPLVVCCETDCISGLTCERADGSQEQCP